MLTANQIIERGIVYLSDEAKEKYPVPNLEPAQAGIDLHMISCSKIKNDTFGIIYADYQKDPATGKTKKTKLPSTEEVKLMKDDEGQFWLLDPGQYEIGFAEGCKFDTKAVGRIVHRSSVRRCGEEINSPLWDPGFYTNEMGTFLTVDNKVKIYYGARVAQMIVFETKEEAEAYDGQYQGKGTLHGENK